MIKASTPRLTAIWYCCSAFCSSARVRNVWGINRIFASYFHLVFVPVCWISRHKSRGYTFVTRPTAHNLCMRCLAKFFVASEYSRVRPSRGRSSTACVCRSFYDARGQSDVRAQPLVLHAPARLRFVARCALVTRCLQWDMTRYQTTDTILEIGAWK